MNLNMLKKKHKADKAFEKYEYIYGIHAAQIIFDDFMAFRQPKCQIQIIYGIPN